MLKTPPRVGQLVRATQIDGVSPSFESFYILQLITSMSDVESAVIGYKGGQVLDCVAITSLWES